MAVTQKFKGLLFGINLGFYKGDRLCISAMDAADGQQGTSVQWNQYFENLTKDGQPDGWMGTPTISRLQTESGSWISSQEVQNW